MLTKSISSDWATLYKTLYTFIEEEVPPESVNKGNCLTSIFQMKLQSVLSRLLRKRSEGTRGGDYYSNLPCLLLFYDGFWLPGSMLPANQKQCLKILVNY